MIELSHLIGQDAIALGTADKIGTVVGIRTDGARLVEIELSKRTIRAAAVRSFDGDVLTFDETLSTPEPGEFPPADPRGMTVLDLHGDSLGALEDLTISADGLVETLVLASGDIVPGSRLRAIGTYAAIVSVDS